MSKKFLIFVKNVPDIWQKVPDIWQKVLNIWPKAPDIWLKVPNSWQESSSHSMTKMNWWNKLEILNFLLFTFFDAEYSTGNGNETGGNSLKIGGKIIWHFCRLSCKKETLQLFIKISGLPRKKLERNLPIKNVLWPVL